MKIIESIKKWWKRETEIAGKKVVVHFRLPSGRTFDHVAIDPKQPAKK
jgi:hypothetical protein